MNELVFEAGAAAFGDANHPTTALLLNALEALAEQMQPARICDMGCGSGILSLRAAQLWPDTRIIAADLERTAVQATARNASANAMTNITAIHADGFRDPAIEAAAPYDMILMNILAEPILRLLPDATRLCGTGGLLLLSGMLNWQQEQIIEANQMLGMELTHRFQQGDWVAHLWQKP